MRNRRRQDMKALKDVKGDDRYRGFPTPLWPAYSTHTRESALCRGSDTKGTPLDYFDAGGVVVNEISSNEIVQAQVGSTRISTWDSMRTFLCLLTCGLACRGELSAVPLLMLRSYVGEWKFGHFGAVLYLVCSALGASYTYYRHCSEIERWKETRPIGTEKEWKCQPGRQLDEDRRRWARKLGTFNAGLAAVLGSATMLFRDRTKLYFDVAEYGIVWYLATYVIFFVWIEFFAYSFHRFFHLRFIYHQFHAWHHKFQPPTAFSAVAFHPIEFACYVLGGQMIFFVVPIHPTVMLVVGGYTGYYLIEDHSGIRTTPPWPWQPTTMYHDDHHRYFHVNFGQHVLWFDWLFGTLRVVQRKYGEECFGGHGASPVVVHSGRDIGGRNEKADTCEGG